MNGVVAVTVGAPLAAAMSALVTAGLLQWRRPQWFGGRLGRAAFVGLWLVLMPLVALLGLLLADGLAHPWRYAAQLGLASAVLARVAALPCKPRLHWLHSLIAFVAGATAAAAARLADPNSGNVGGLLVAATVLPSLVLLALFGSLQEATTSERRRHELARWGVVALLSGVFGGLLPSLNDRHQRVEAARPIVEAIARARRDAVLDLSQQRLDRLPDELSTLPELRLLDLTGCELPALSDGIAALTKLEELRLDRNALVDPAREIERIAKLPSLRVLRLGDNRLTSLPAAIGQARTLVELSLHHNQLTTLPDELFSLPALRVLQLGSELDGNRLAALPPAIERLESLEVLDLRNNPITALPVEIERLPRLKTLYLPESIGQAERARLAARLPRTTILPAP